MTKKSVERVRLCPNCANVIDDEAVRCLYCNSDLSSDDMPQWLNREAPSEPRAALVSTNWLGRGEKFVWPLALVVVAVIAFFAGDYMQRGQGTSASQASAKQLQAKEAMIQSQELELTQLRQQMNESSTQLAASKSKIEESQKELATAQQRLTDANREMARLSAARSTTVARSYPRSAPVAQSTVARSSDMSAPAPVPSSAPSSRYPSMPPSGSASSSRASARQVADAGPYETIRPTAVYEDPSPGARVISQIGRGTRINVVNSSGDWLEVRSRHGNPPGYVRAEDARAARAVN